MLGAMFMRLGLQILVALSCSAGIAAGQSTIHICGADLRVGMAKNRVLDIAGAGCELVKLRATDTEMWCAKATEKKNSAYDTCHMLEFDDGFLIYVSKQISEVSGEPVADLVNAVYEFTKVAQADGKTPAVVTKQFEFKKNRYRTISFVVGDRSLVLNIAQPVGSSGSVSSVSLSEELRRPQLPSPKQ
jgi:hypothetical protein